MNDNTSPPSPTPPWAREVQSPQTQTITGDGAISLTVDVTYLQQANPKDPQNLDTPYALTLPSGNYLRQNKRIFVPGSLSSTTAPFQVAGTFTGFGSLLFNRQGWSAVLEWDGSGWSLIGGNALPQN
jgi:hypothetical protein